MTGHHPAVGTTLAQRPTGSRPRDRHRGPGGGAAPAVVPGQDRRADRAVGGRPGTGATVVADEPCAADLLLEVRALRDSVQRSVDLHGAYRDAAAERALRITELHRELDEERAEVALLRASDARYKSRAADLEQRLGSAVARARTADTVATELRGQVERLDARGRRLTAVVATLEQQQRRRAREQERHERLRGRRSVRLALWCLDRPSVRRLLRLVGAVER